MAALAAVNQRAKLNHWIPKARAGLMYPDPGYIVSINPENRAYAIAAWLSIRPARCGQLLYPASPQMPVISAPVWRQFFWIYRRRPASNAANPVLDDELDAATAAATLMFGADMVASMNRTTREVFWRGQAYGVDDGAVVGLGSGAVREIVWELAELNWRYEVLTLDKFAAPHMWLDDDAAGHRITAILLIFSPSSSFVLTHSPFPTENVSISATTRAERMKAMTALRGVMSEWRACPRFIKQGLSNYTPSCSDSPDARVLEVQTMLHYCQTFFEYFHRPPILPYQLPI